MDNLGSQVGQKMRSAVKAKLIELGTGGAAGYIDDELPDYVMIMVANKRSKQQMIADLSLFLGSHTELFVTWLHEVLQKLQEVTLPANVVHKTKRKSSDTETTNVSTKKEKKDKKKDKKSKKTNEKSTTESAPVPAPPSSISDVFANHLLEKAKKSTAVEPKSKKESATTATNNATDEFDIPTITEISAEQNSEQNCRERDLNELAELQKKINQAKRQLKGLESESEDEDFLNIKEDAEELDEIVGSGGERSTVAKKNNSNNLNEKSPILFNEQKNKEETKENRINFISSGNVNHQKQRQHHYHHHHNHDHQYQQQQQQEKYRKHTPIVYNPADKKNSDEGHCKKKSIHERLGYRTTTTTTTIKNIENTNNSLSSTSNRRAEKELYVPSYRRKEPEKEIINSSRNKKHETKDDTESSDEDDRTKNSSSSSKTSIRRRIGSRVIVAPPKPEYRDEDEDAIDRPVNSLIKIKPRPPVSPSKQASKNLLLRAVAEAQKSTALVKPKTEFVTSLASAVNASSSTRIQKLYTKSYRDRNREAVLKRATKDNIVIEVNANDKKLLSRIQKYDEDEYVPEPISDRGDSDDYVYVPQIISSARSDHTHYDGRDGDVDGDISRNKTQFVVTLDEKTRDKYISKHKIRVVEKNSSGIEIKTSSLPEKIIENANLNVITDPLGKKIAKPQTLDNYKKPNEVKKLIIKNDSEDDESSSPSKDNNNKDKIEEERSTTPPLPKLNSSSSSLKRKRSTVSPIKFDIDEKHEAKKDCRSKSGERDVKKNDYDSKEKDEEKIRVSTKKVDSSKKYDNIPEFLSAISVDSSAVKNKTKERCKYFPSCGKGDSCEFHHPTLPCKAFPNCKFADKCLYLHPKCKFDLTCNRIGCNYSHSGTAAVPSVAPPLSSHVVPVQNYKSITATPLPAMCKYYPNCTNSLCNFYHPKLCRFGKNCANKIECNFYHHDLPNKDKFKWVASLG